MSIMTYQDEFCPALPTVFAGKDYREYRADLETVDRILKQSGIENNIIFSKIENEYSDLSSERKQKKFQTLLMALRYSLLLGYTGMAKRELSRVVADSILFQWFTGTNRLDGIHPVSKSTLDRFEKLYSKDEIMSLVHKINLVVSEEKSAQDLLYSETKIRFDRILSDSTCIEANIHFPVDWVLLRDVARTLVKAVILIREHGLKHRIRSPKKLLNEMNKLCMEMTHARRKQDAKKMRKRILRKMKKLTKIIGEHASRYHELLSENWEQTTWSELEKQIVLERIEDMLEQLPDAVKQAHERIIGERRIDNKDKILSVYDKDAQILVRGKAGAEVEFGNALYIAEQENGLIVDWEFMTDKPTADSKLLKPSIERITENYGKISSYTADRGFSSPKNNIVLEELDIINAVCPRSVKQMKERLQDEEFCHLQKRRASTEARISILKYNYFQNPLRSKGGVNKERRLAWGILAHNIWKLAMIARQNKQDIEKAQAVAA